jgi:hypothetical protein
MFDWIQYSNLGSTLVVFTVGGFLSLLAQGIWRLYFSPVAKFPGPKLAALTYWYVCHFNDIRGRYISLSITSLE